MTARALLTICLLGGCAATAGAADQPSSVAALNGEALYRAACAACHGPNGKGSPPSLVGFDTPLPDFTDCGFATPEPDADWMAVIHQGGPVRAFSRMMPAFDQALSEEAIQRVLDHIRGFCGSTDWPRGELNLPRAFVTEKAYPENEAVLSTSIVGGDDGTIGTELLYERRFGARSQIELGVPIEARHANGRWENGLGDIALAIKRVLFHSLGRGTIFTAAAEATLPSGKASAGLGKGFAVFEPFVALGQVLPSDGFLQVQTGLELPADANRSAAEAFWRVAAGKSWFEGRFGRSWSPMIELLAAREVGGDATLWDVLPQMQVTLSKRQHVIMSAGVRIPLSARDGRRTQVMTYLLWDWFDGGLFDGWK